MCFHCARSECDTVPKFMTIPQNLILAAHSYFVLIQVTLLFFLAQSTRGYTRDSS